MSNSPSRKKKLRVSSSGGARYVEVASSDAIALQEYLRGRGIQASTPAPCSSNLDTIQFAGGLDTATLQGVLDGWV